MSDLSMGGRRPSRHRIAIALVPVMMVGAVLFSSGAGGDQYREITAGAVGAAGGAIVGAVAGAPLIGAVAGAAGGVALAKLVMSQAQAGNIPCLINCGPAEVVRLPAR